MGSYLDEDEFNRWITNASSTLKSALNDGESGFYNWACFKAQQASEFSIKAYLRGTGNDSFGNSISMLLQKGDFDTAIINKAKKLDKYYIPTRYTDSWSDGTPEDYYTKEDAFDAIECSRSIITEIESKWRSLKSELKKEKE